MLDGLRSLTAPAVVAWAAYFGLLQLNSPLSWMTSKWSVGILTLAALGELVADKLPSTPSRTEFPGLAARIVMGALAGACIAMAGRQSWMIGAALGLVGGIAGTFAGYQARKNLVAALRIRDLPIAILEDLLAIAGSICIVLLVR